MHKLIKCFCGDKIDCLMRLYRPEFIADLAKQESDWRKRTTIARVGGYLARAMDVEQTPERK